MSETLIQGKVYVVGDDVDTDAILPARHMIRMDPEFLAKHAMEDLDPEKYSIPFLNQNGTCDYNVIVAGKNFGCGSSREHAPIALSAAGIKAVVAPSFARIYYRNSVNGGIILPLESEVDFTEDINTGDEVSILLAENPLLQIRGAGEYILKPFGPVKEIIGAGGLTDYNKKRLGL